MPRTCTICTSPDREAIEQAIAAGTSYRDIACQFSVGRMAVGRHADGHIRDAIAQSQEAKEEAQAINVVKQLKDINGVTLDIMRKARENKKDGLALFAIDRLQKQLELQAKLLGDLDERPQVNILLTGEWVTVRAALTNSLAPYAEARAAVASALLRIEQGVRS